MKIDPCIKHFMEKWATANTDIDDISKTIEKLQADLEEKKKAKEKLPTDFMKALVDLFNGIVAEKTVDVDAYGFKETVEGMIAALKIQEEGAEGVKEEDNKEEYSKEEEKKSFSQLVKEKKAKVDPEAEMAALEAEKNLDFGVSEDEVPAKAQTSTDTKTESAKDSDVALAYKSVVN